jgi:hypothetical protein
MGNRQSRAATELGALDSIVSDVGDGHPECKEAEGDFRPVLNKSVPSVCCIFETCTVLAKKGFGPTSHLLLHVLVDHKLPFSVVLKEGWYKNAGFLGILKKVWVGHKGRGVVCSAGAHGDALMPTLQHYMNRFREDPSFGSLLVLRTKPKASPIVDRKKPNAKLEFHPVPSLEDMYREIEKAFFRREGSNLLPREFIGKIEAALEKSPEALVELLTDTFVTFRQYVEELAAEARRGSNLQGDALEAEVQRIMDDWGKSPAMLVRRFFCCYTLMATA